MAITDVPRVFIPPILEGMNTLTPNFNADQNIAASTSAQGWAFRVPKTGTLDKVEFRSGTTSSFPVNGIRVSFQNLDASGVPDGTQDQYRDITSGASYPNTSWIVPGLMTSDGTDTGTKRSVTAGDYLGVVVECASFVAGDSFQVASLNGSALADEGIQGQHAFLRKLTGTWSVRSGKYPPMALKYSDGSYVPIGHPKWAPLLGMSSASFNSGSTPDERGLRFVLPMSMRVSGAWVRGNFAAACDVVLYDASDTVVASSTITPFNFGQNNLVPLAQTTLSASVVYRLVLKPTSGSNVSLYHFSVNTNALLAACPAGTDFYYTQRTDAGAWTDTNTACPWMGLLVDGVDAGGGSAGGSYAFA